MKPKKLKIAFIGNQNNNHFAFVRYLRDKNYCAELLLTDSEQEHFHPRCDTFNTEYMEYTKQLDWGGLRSFRIRSRKSVARDLSAYDVLVGTGLAPAYVNQAKKRLDIFIPYGEDIWGMTLYRIVAPHLQHKQLSSAYYQRRGMRATKAVHTATMNEFYESQVHKFAPNAMRWLAPVPMVYAPEYEREPVETMSNRTHWGHIFSEIRESTQLMILSSARHVWYDKYDHNTKGTDILLRGYCEFCSRWPKLKSKLILIEYGKDVEKSKKFVENCGFTNRFAWLPKMYRKDLMVGLKKADIVCGQFGISWIQNGVLLEALVASKPLLTWRDDRRFEKYATLYPIYNANTPEVISQQLEEYIANPSTGREMGRQCRQWYENEVVATSLKKYEEFFEARSLEIGTATR